MKKLLPGIIILLTHFVALSQKNDEVQMHSNSQIFAAGGGPGISLSINYEKEWGRKKSGMGFSAGAGFLPLGIGSGGFTFPAGLNYIHGNRHCYEIGIGIVPLILTGKTRTDKNELFAYSLVGYRRYFKGTRVVGRIFFSPLFTKRNAIIGGNFDSKGRIVPYGGVSIGLTLKRVTSQG